MNLEGHHHYVRNVGGSKLLDNGTVDGSAFRRRPEDVDGVSGNWVEYFSGHSVTEAMVEIRRAFDAKGRKIPAQSRFALLNVGDTKTHVLTAEKRAIEFVHACESQDPSHAVISGYQPEDEIIADCIAQTVKQLLPGRP